jgi:hypothetical protein
MEMTPQQRIAALPDFWRTQLESLLEMLSDKNATFSGKVYRATERINGWLRAASLQDSTPVAAPATADDIRKEMVAKYGDCCKGGDPFCAGGCLVEKAIRRDSATAPQATDDEDVSLLDALKHGNGLIAEVMSDLEDLGAEKADAIHAKLREASHHFLGCTIQCEEEAAAPLAHCHAGKDGDCIWKDCPQNRDGEPNATGRHCPLDIDEDDEDAPEPPQPPRQKSQGLCEVTSTERFDIGGCDCPTYPGNLGPCAEYELGGNGRCVYCDHTEACHAKVSAPSPARQQEAPATKCESICVRPEGHEGECDDL